MPALSLFLTPNLRSQTLACVSGGPQGDRSRPRLSQPADPGAAAVRQAAPGEAGVALTGPQRQLLGPNQIKLHLSHAMNTTGYREMFTYKPLTNNAVLRKYSSEK